MSMLLLALVFLSTRAHAAADPVPNLGLERAPAENERAILRTQRSGSHFEVLRCISQDLSEAAIERSLCESLGQTDLDTVDRALEKLAANQPLTGSEKRNIAGMGLLVMGAGIAGPAGVMYLASRFGGELSRGTMRIMIPVVGGVALVAALIQYSKVGEFRGEMREALGYTRNLLAAKIPDEREYVQPFPNDLWVLFNPDMFTGVNGANSAPLVAE